MMTFTKKTRMILSGLETGHDCRVGEAAVLHLNAGLLLLLLLLTPSPVALQCRRQIVDQRMAALRLVLDIPCSEEGRRKNAVYPKSEGQSGRGPPVRQSSEPRTGILPPAFPPFLLPPQCLDKKQTQMLGSLGSGSETTACHEISWSFRWAAFMPSAHRQGFLPMG